MSQKIPGIAASDGIGIAPAYLLVQPDLSYAAQRSQSAAAEYARVQRAFQAAVNELATLKQRAAARLSGDDLAVFDAHVAILTDPELLAQIKAALEQSQLTAEAAVDQVTAQFAATLAAMTDNQYMQERATDVQDVAKRALSHLLGRPLPDLAAIDRPVVIVAHEITPSETSQLDARLVKGLVTDQGGRTSHAAIMARTLRIPAVVGTENVTDQAQSGQTIVVDGLAGLAVVDPTPQELASYDRQADDYLATRATWAQLVDAPSRSKDGREFEIAANIGTPADVADALQQGADGVGLFRSEFLYMGSDHLPTETEQLAAYKQAVLGMAGRPLVVRTLDIGGDKPLPYLPLPAELNPFLGYRAIRICLDRPDIFKTQLRALIRAAEFGPLSIMFPMIATMAELRAAKHLFAEAKAEVQRGHPGLGDAIKVGMMIEVPLAAINADQLAQETDFFSIGTNDLIQYCFAADRGNDAVSYLYQPLNPALLKLIKQVIDAAHAHGIPAAMCGEMAGDPLALPLLMGMGLDEYSMSAASILRARAMMAQLDTQECAALVTAALNQTTADEVATLVKDRLPKR